MISSLLEMGNTWTPTGVDISTLMFIVRRNVLLSSNLRNSNATMTAMTAAMIAKGVRSELIVRLGGEESVNVVPAVNETCYLSS